MADIFVAGPDITPPSLAAGSTLGRSSNPYRSLAAALLAMSAGDTLYGAGTFRESVTKLRMNQHTFKRWDYASDAPVPTVTPAQLLTGNIWSAQSGYYTTVLPVGSTVRAVVIDWGIIVDSSGRRGGCLQQLNGTSEFATNNDSWYYDGATRTLGIRLGANAVNPNNGTVTIQIVPDGVAATLYGVGDSNLILGWDFDLNCNGDAGSGYGVKFAGTNNVIDGCRGRLNGYHHFGMVDQASFGNSGNTIQNCKTYGCYADGPLSGLFHYVFYAQTVTITNGRGINNEAYRHGPIRRDLSAMTEITPGGGTIKSDGGYFSHQGTGNTASLVWDNCLSYNYADTIPGGADFGAANTADVSSTGAADLVPANYAVRVRDCSIVGGWTNLFNTSMSFERCRLRFPYLNNWASAQGANGGKGWIGFDGPSGNPRALFRECAFVTDLSTAAVSNTNRFLIGCNGTAKVLLQNCSLFDAGPNTGTTNARGFINQANNSTVYANGCIFACATSRSTNNWLTLSSATIDKYVFTDNQYINIGSYSGTSGSANQAGWTSTIDPNGVYGSTVPFATATLATDWALTTGTERLRKKVLAAAGAVGLNGLAYDANYGAMQYPVVPAVVGTSVTLGPVATEYQIVQLPMNNIHLRTIRLKVESGSPVSVIARVPQLHGTTPGVGVTIAAGSSIDFSISDGEFTQLFVSGSTGIVSWFGIDTPLNTNAAAC